MGSLCSTSQAPDLDCWFIGVDDDDDVGVDGGHNCGDVVCEEDADTSGRPFLWRACPLVMMLGLMMVMVMLSVREVSVTIAAALCMESLPRGKPRLSPSGERTTWCHL